MTWYEFSVPKASFYAQRKPQATIAKSFTNFQV